MARNQLSRTSSHEYRRDGLMSPNRRRAEIRRIIEELRIPGEKPGPARPDEVEGAATLLFRFHSAEVAGLMAQALGVDLDTIRRCLDDALSWKPSDPAPPHAP